MGPSLRAHAGQSKPYWQEGLASRAATQGALNSKPPADNHLPPEEAAASADAGAGQGGDPQPKPQTVSQQLPQQMSPAEPEAKPRSAVPPKHSQGLPPMPQPASSADGPQSEQMQRGLAPRTMLVTPLAPAARRVSASGQPSWPSSTPQQGDPQQAGASGQLSRPGSTVHLSASVQPGTFQQPGSLEQPNRPGSAKEMLQLPPPVSTERLPSLNSIQLNAQTSSMQAASFGRGQHLQQGPDISAHQDTLAAEWHRGGQADSRPSQSAQQLTGIPSAAQHQERPLHGEQAEESMHSQHMHFAAEMAQPQQQQQHLGVSYDAPAASYASHSVALGIPAAHMHNTGMAANPAYSVLPSLAMHSSWMPHAACATNHMPQQLPMHEQHDAFRQQKQHHVGQPMPVPLSHQSGVPGPMQAAQLPADSLLQLHPASSAEGQPEQHYVGQPMLVPLSHQSGVPDPMQAAQLPAGSLPQPHPASSTEGQQEQHEVASVAPRRVRAPPGFLRAPQVEPRPLQDMLAQLQLPERYEQQDWPMEDLPMQQPLSQPQDGPMPWLPNAPPNQVPHVPVPDSSVPAPERMRHIRPQPQKGDLASSCLNAYIHTAPAAFQPYPAPLGCTQDSPNTLHKT